MSSSAEVASLAGEGSVCGIQAVAARASTWGSRSSSTAKMSAPAMPSIMAWWVLLTMAQRPPSRPSTSQVSHSGRERSRCSDMMCAVRSRSDSSVPGRGRVACLTWSPMRNRASSAQTGRPSSSGTRSARCRYRGIRSSRDSMAAMSSACEGAGPSNSRTEPTCSCWVSRSISSHQLSRGLRRSAVSISVIVGNMELPPTGPRSRFRSGDPRNPRRGLLRH